MINIKPFLILTALTALMLSAGSCELFENPPAHDNVLDPLYESSLTDNGDWRVTVYYDIYADTVSLSWTVNDDDVITKIASDYYVFWSAGNNIDSASKSSIIDGSGSLSYTINGLAYANTYNIWIQGVAAEEKAGVKIGEELFLKTGSATPVTKGEQDPGFNSGQPLTDFFTTSPNYPDCQVNYIAAEGTGFYATGFRDEPSGEQFGDYFIRSVAAAGTDNTSYSDDGELTINTSSYPSYNNFHPVVRSSGLISFRDGSTRPFYCLGDDPTIIDTEATHGISDLRMKTVILLSDNSFIFGGGKSAGAWYDLRIYHASADLNSSSGNFTENSSTYSGGTADESYVTDLALSPDENYVYAAGYFNNALGIFAARLTCPGLAGNNNFDLSGSSRWGTAVSSTEGRQCIAVDSAGRIYLAGEEVLGRFGTDAAADTAFGTDGDGTVGTAVLDTGFTPVEMIIQPDNKILLCGYTAGSGIVYRLNTDGSLDTGFGEDGGTAGKFIRDDHRFLDMDVTSAGKIIIGGVNTSTSSHKGAVFCLR